MDSGGDTGPLVLGRSLELPNHTDKRRERRRSVKRQRETNDKTGETFLVADTYLAIALHS